MSAEALRTGGVKRKPYSHRAKRGENPSVEVCYSAAEDNYGLIHRALRFVV